MPGNWNAGFSGKLRSNNNNLKMWLFVVLCMVPVGVFGTTGASAAPTTPEEPTVEYVLAEDDGKYFDIRNVTGSAILDCNCTDLNNDAVYYNSMEPNKLTKARPGLSSGTGELVPGPTGNASLVTNHTLEKHFHDDCPSNPLSCDEFTLSVWFSILANNEYWVNDWPSAEDIERTLVSINNNILIKSNTSKDQVKNEVNIHLRKSSSKMAKLKISNLITEVMGQHLVVCIDVPPPVNMSDCITTKNVSWQWNHIVVTATKLGDTFNVSIYWNGNAVRKNQIELIDEMDIGTPGDQSGIILNKEDVSENGSVAFDDFAMWNRTLNQTDAVQLRVSKFCDSGATDPPKIDLKEIVPAGTLPDQAQAKDHAKVPAFVLEDSGKITKGLKDLAETHEYVDPAELSDFVEGALETLDIFAAGTEDIFQDANIDNDKKEEIAQAVAESFNGAVDLISKAGISPEDKEKHVNDVVNNLETFAASMMQSAQDITVTTDFIDMEVKQASGNSGNLRFAGGVEIPNSALQGNAASVVKFLYSKLKGIYSVKVPTTGSNTGNSGRRKREDSTSTSACVPQLASDLLSINADGNIPGAKLKEPITFPAILQLSGEDRENCPVPTCGYLNAEGEFATDGVTTIKVDENNVKCESEHLTNFAVLMAVTDLKISEQDSQNLSILTIVCTSISLVALFIAILILFIFRELRGTRISILKHLSIAMFCAQLVFITAVEKAAVNKKLCLVISVFIHYLYLSVFFWMLAQGLFLYMKLRLAVRSDANIIWFCLIGWGFPAILVTTTAGINIKAYGGRDDLCWLNIDNGGAWAFVGPVLAIIAINCVVIVMAMKAFTSVKSFKDKDDKEKMKSTLKAMVVMLPLLGLTWFFGVFAHIPGTGGLAFMYIFAICNGLQGFFLFVFHIVFNAEVS
ncbi:uncharacterized protein [Amphiura filiformis]|uniref:uncharacterized protein n=1 Tax=Amphiura filiformis TaxID=82378 RepID=UPI003B226660